MFTPTGLGVNGLKVQCFINVEGVAALEYDYSAGVGADFIFAGGEAMVDAGGAFRLTKAYAKYSPWFSGAGMSKDAIFKQCINNYVMSWVGVELMNWVNEYSGLRLVQKAVNVVVREPEHARFIPRVPAPICACADLLRWQRLICSPVLVALSKYAAPPSASAREYDALELPAQRPASPLM